MRLFIKYLLKILFIFLSFILIILPFILGAFVFSYLCNNFSFINYILYRIWDLYHFLFDKHQMRVGGTCTNFWTIYRMCRFWFFFGSRDGNGTGAIFLIEDYFYLFLKYFLNSVKFLLLLSIIFLFIYFILRPLFKTSNILIKIILSILYTQILLLILIINYSYFFLIFFELWVILLILVLLFNFSDGSFYNFFYFLIFISSMLNYFFIFIKTTSLVIVLVVFFLILKIFLCNIFFLITISMGNKFINRFCLNIYIFNSKLLTILYILVYYSFFSKISIFNTFFNLFNLYFYILIFITTTILIYIFILIDDIEGYLFSLLCLSYYLIILGSLISFKISILSFLSDVVVCIFILIFLYNDLNFLNGQYFLSFNSFFIFIFLSHSIGIPPFPSFFLEVNFLFTILLSSNIIIKIFFIIFFYFFLVSQLIMIFSKVNRFSNIHSIYYNYKNLNKTNSILFIIFICFYFIM